MPYSLDGDSADAIIARLGALRDDLLYGRSKSVDQAFRELILITVELVQALQDHYIYVGEEE